MAFFRSLKSNIVVQTTNSSVPPFIAQPVYQRNHLNYNAALIQSTTFRLMETLYIMNTSQAIDTIIGRYPHLLSSLSFLRSAQNNIRYRSDIQTGIDNYKNIYFDRMPDDFQIAALIDPNRFDIDFFYCHSLLNGLRKFAGEQNKELSKLQQRETKKKRLVKIISLIQQVRTELLAKCGSLQNLPVLIEQLNDTEAGYRNITV